MNEALNNTLLMGWQSNLTTLGVKLISVVALFFVGRWGAKQLQQIVRKIMTKARMDASLISFASQFTYYGILFLIALSIMGQLGIETTSLIAMLGAAGVAIGLALQGSLSNFSAGLLLIIFHPFRVGDLIEGAGITGIVEEIQLFSTSVLTEDNRLVIIPNSKLVNDTIINHSSKGTLRVDMVIGISYEENLQRVKKVISEILASDPRVLQTPVPEIGVLELSENYLRLGVRPWTNSRNYWAVHFHTHEQLVERFRKEGICMPSSKQDVHIHSITSPESRN
jgi:small conductance mechanosensitive channel